MAYTAKCDTATATKWWITGTGSTLNRLSEVMDDNPTGVEENDNPGSHQPWTKFMTEIVEDRLYQIHLDFEVGDGSTSTTLVVEGEDVYCDDGVMFEVQASATFNLGKKQGDWSILGGSMSFSPSGRAMKLADGGTVGIYGSKLHHRSDVNKAINFNTGTVEILNTILGAEDYSSTLKSFQFQSSLSDLTMKDIYCSYTRGSGLNYPGTFEDLRMHYNAYGARSQQDSEITNLTITDSQVKDIRTNSTNNDLVVVDPDIEPTQSDVQNLNNGNSISIKYTFNITVLDNTGSALSGVSVDLDDKNGSAAFSTQTTDANGQITEQDVLAIIWEDASETETDYRNFTLTLTKAGYKTTKVKGININRPMRMVENLPHGRGALVKHHTIGLTT